MTPDPILLTGRLQVRAQLFGKRRRRQHTGERAPAEDPAAQGPIVTHVHRKDESTLRAFPQLLRCMPDPRPYEGRSPRFELDLHFRGGAGVDAQRVGEYLVVNVLLRHKGLLFERD